ncbi:MAG TPA: isoprenylcysteine carboxylmethyltransferase family protein [Bryobacteraceae bacterium]|nr:isoprenylcysteine carboxylmethyltransferase family protein [Bryobacteraceae bacterium]
MQARSVIGAAWLMFFAYWWLSAIGVKKNVRRRSLRWEAGFRIVAVAVIVALSRIPGNRAFFEGRAPAAIDTTEIAAGLIIAFAGFALAVWARVHLGRNWGMPMSFKEGHELVTGGPYGYVRHPIYTGMLLAMFGSALVTGPVWLLIFVGMAIYCVHSARTEEQLMLQAFPEQYRHYKQRTKAFIPFVI